MQIVFKCSPKGMVTIISESTISLHNLWSRRIEEGGTAGMKIDEYTRRYSGDLFQEQHLLFAKKT